MSEKSKTYTVTTAEVIDGMIVDFRNKFFVSDLSAYSYFAKKLLKLADMYGKLGSKEIKVYTKEIEENQNIPHIKEIIDKITVSMSSCTLNRLNAIGFKCTNKNNDTVAVILSPKS